MLGVWDITESIEDMRDQLQVDEIPSIKNELRLRQYLGSRILLQEMLRELKVENVRLHKMDSGQPYLSIPQWNVSISHADRFAAIALSPQRIGIDIEKLSPRIKRIQNKFMNKEELACLKDEEDLNWMHVVWSAKEALFKYHPGRDFDFRTHLLVKPEGNNRLHAEIHQTHPTEQLYVEYEWIQDFVLAWTEF